MKKGTLYTSYYANIKNGVGMKISVSATVPKWLGENDLDWNMGHVVPPRELLFSYKTGGIEFEDYMVEYQKHLNSNDVDVNMEISYLIDLLNNGKDVTIYCYEKDYHNCHRHMIGHKFKGLGFTVKEIGAE